MGRIVLVTGGISGIGAATARLFKSLGHEVIASYAANHSLAESFNRQTGIAVLGWNIADFAATRQAIDRIASTHGPVEILVNNAGIVRDCMLHKMTAEQ